jgi:hypothetical protein
LGKRDRTRGFLANYHLLPPLPTGNRGGGAGRRRRLIRPARGPASAVEGGKRRREARGFDSRPYLGPRRREEAGPRKQVAAVSGARQGGARGSERELGAVVETKGKVSCARGRFIGE